MRFDAFSEAVPAISVKAAPTDRDWIKGLRASAPKLAADHPKAFKDLNDGMPFTQSKVQPDMVATNLPATARVMRTAFFIVQGAEDHISPTAVALDYFVVVHAPFKRWITIPDAGHFAWMTSPDAFLSVLIRKVRPIAIRRGA